MFEKMKMKIALEVLVDTGKPILYEIFFSSNITKSSATVAHTYKKPT